MTSSSDLVPLADRSAALQWMRLVLGVGVVLGAQWPEVVGTPDHDLTLLAVTHVAATSAVELLRRALRRRALPVVSGLLLVDGLFLAAVVAETGGSSSPLLFLVHVHIAAAALLATFRSGLLVAAWHGALLVATGYADWVGEVPAHPTVLDASAIASFALVGVGAVLVARVNERALRRSRWAANALVELGSSLERSRRSDDVALVAADHFAARLGYRRAAILIAGTDEWMGAMADDRGAFLALVPGATTSAAELNGPTPARHVDATAEPGLVTLLPGACHVVTTPLVADERLLGVLAVECGPDRPDLSAEELHLLAASSDRVTLALRTATLLTEVERLATSDALTGLPNRRLFDDTLGREVARAKRSGIPLALALVDVDHFKAVNDEQGHQVGDEVLRQLGSALRGAVRSEAFVARYGGEEFVVIVPGATVEDAAVVAERLRAAARTVSAVPVTISVGVAALSDADDAETMVAAADAALYRAKAAGRDRVVCHEQAAGAGTFGTFGRGQGAGHWVQDLEEHRHDQALRGGQGDPHGSCPLRR